MTLINDLKPTFSDRLQPGEKAYGVDLMVEFKDNTGKPCGHQIFLQVKAGNSKFRKRFNDGTRHFKVENKDHVKYWMNHKQPTYLVHRNAAGGLFWMERRDSLRLQTNFGQREIKEILFRCEEFSVENLLKVRDAILNSTSNHSPKV